MILAACFVIRVLGASMAPALQHKAFYECCPVDSVARGDVVFFEHPIPSRVEHLVKRVTGVPGDSLGARFGREVPAFELRDVIPEGSLYVKGDNPLGRYDSRTFGLIGRGQVLGRVVP